MKSQNAEVLAMLKKRREGITALDAMTELNIWRLAARIKNLRDQGYDIRTEMEEHQGGKHARYYLA